MYIHQIVGSTLLPCLTNPILAGYIYGLTNLATTPEFTNELKTSPLMTTFDLISYATMYSMGANFLSYLYRGPNRIGDYVICGVLVGVSSYKLYKTIKLAKKND